MYKLYNHSFWYLQNSLLDFDGCCIGSRGQVGQKWHHDNIKSTNPWIHSISLHLFIFSLISLIKVCYFLHVYPENILLDLPNKILTYVLNTYFFGAIVNGIFKIFKFQLFIAGMNFHFWDIFSEYKILSWQL